MVKMIRGANILIQALATAGKAGLPTWMNIMIGRSPAPVFSRIDRWILFYFRLNGQWYWITDRILVEYSMWEAFDHVNTKSVRCFKWVSGGYGLWLSPIDFVAMCTMIFGLATALAINVKPV